MNSIWLILLTVFFIGVQGMIYRRFAMHQLDYQRYYSVSRCFVGDQVEMVEQIKNDKLLPVPWVKLESSLSAHLKFTNRHAHAVKEGKVYQNHRSLFSLMPYTEIVRRHRFTCERRGVFELGTATLTVGDLFGMYSMYSTIATGYRLIVYPKPVLPEGFSRPYNSRLGDVTVRRWINPDPFIFAGIREYQNGDSMRDVNWKATARSGRLQVNQHDFTADRRVMVYLNVEDHESMWQHVSNEDLIERGISYAAGIIEEVIHAGMEAGFACNGVLENKDKEAIFIEPEGGRGHYEFILEKMALMKIARSMSFDQLLTQGIHMRPMNQDIIFITSYMNDRLYEKKRQFEYDGNTVSVLLLEGGSYTKLEGGDTDRPAIRPQVSLYEVAATAKEATAKEGVG